MALAAEDELGVVESSRAPRRRARRRRPRRCRRWTARARSLRRLDRERRFSGQGATCAFSFSAARARAAALAERLADAPDRDVTAVARRPHRDPKPRTVPMRIGGFGGAAGLRAISSSTALDCRGRCDASLRRAIIRQCRAGLRGDRRAAARAAPPALAARSAGDRWTDVGDDAGRRRGARGTRRAASSSRSAASSSRLSPSAPQHHYLVRSDRADRRCACRCRMSTLCRRAGRSTRMTKRDLMRTHGIEVVVTQEFRRPRDLRQDRGGARARPAGRHGARGPPQPDVAAVDDVDEAFAWLELMRSRLRTERGV